MVDDAVAGGGLTRQRTRDRIPEMLRRLVEQLLRLMRIELQGGELTVPGQISQRGGQIAHGRRVVRQSATLALRYYLTSQCLGLKTRARRKSTITPNTVRVQQRVDVVRFQRLAHVLHQGDEGYDALNRRPLFRFRDGRLRHARFRFRVLQVPPLVQQPLQFRQLRAAVVSVSRQAHLLSQRRRRNAGLHLSRHTTIRGSGTGRSCSLLLRDSRRFFFAHQWILQNRSFWRNHDRVRLLEAGCNLRRYIQHARMEIPLLV
mmetsp:Transcript_28289/g.71779  ORF Transcript_28289/g.71779 Transcript_28289/m.71779 type:complete len:260 (+) Transcript_28289:2404-3183(+)